MAIEPGEVEELAQRVAELLVYESVESRQMGQLVDAAAVARLLGVSAPPSMPRRTSLGRSGSEVGSGPGFVSTRRESSRPLQVDQRVFSGAAPPAFQTIDATAKLRPSAHPREANSDEWSLKVVRQMPRSSIGQIVELDREGGRTFALRFRAYGKRRYITLGTAEEGWTRAKAEEELANVLADVRRGIWKPPKPAPTVQEKQEPTFHEFASEWFKGMRLEGLRPNTLANYEWQLSQPSSALLRGPSAFEITIAEVDRYRQAKIREGELSATSINMTITRLAQILELAIERELISRNPARGKRRRLKQRAPARTWLDRAEQIEALLDAARQLDEEARVDRRSIRRRTLLATLVFAGSASGRPSSSAGAMSIWL